MPVPAEFYVFEGHDLGTYISLEHVQRHLEAPDVVAGRYVGFSRTGAKLWFTVKKGYVVARVDASDNHSSELEQCARETLRDVGVDDSTATDLAAVLAMVDERFPVVAM